MNTEDFKKTENKTYVYVDSKKHGKLKGRYIEVPYSYNDFASMSTEQQMAICQIELGKLNIVVELHELYIDIGRFFYAVHLSEDFYLIKKAVSCLDSSVFENLTEAEKTLIDNLNISYSNIELAKVCGIIAEYSENKNYLLRKQLILLEKGQNVDIIYLINAKMNCLLSESIHQTENNIQLLGEICDLCEEAPLSEEVVQLCDKFTRTLLEQESRLKHRGEVSDLLHLANNICKELNKDVEDSLRSSILGTMKSLRII